LLGYAKTMKFRDLQESLTWKKFFMAIFEFIGQCYFQNDVFKIQEVFSELGIRLFLENGLGVCRDFLFNRFKTNQRCQKDSKNSFENFTQNQTNHLYFGFRKISCGLFSKPLNKGIFSVFGRFSEDYFRNLTC
jgi:hypothetical protein